MIPMVVSRKGANPSIPITEIEKFLNNQYLAVLMLIFIRALILFLYYCDSYYSIKIKYMLTKIATLFVLVMISFMGLAQNTGIGISYPSEKFQVDNGNIKIGSAVWSTGVSNLLKFGDGNYCYIGEQGDDSMRIQANHIQMAGYSGYTKLTINGGLVVKDGTEGVGKVFTSNDVGQGSWQTVSSNPSLNTGFSVSRTSGNQAITSGSYQKISFPYLLFADGSVWNAAFNEYTAPAAGVYNFDARVFLSLASFLDVKQFYIAIFVNNTPVQQIDIFENYNSITGYRPQYNVSGLVKCNAADKVSVQLYQNTGVDQYIVGTATAFSGYRIY
jgi:hypothetical protein